MKLVDNQDQIDPDRTEIDEKIFKQYLEMIKTLTKSKRREKKYLLLRQRYLITFDQFIQLLKSIIFFSEQIKCSEILSKSIWDIPDKTLLTEEFGEIHGKKIENALSCMKKEENYVGGNFEVVSDDNYVSSFEDQSIKNDDDSEEDEEEEEAEDQSIKNDDDSEDDDSEDDEDEDEDEDDEDDEDEDDEDEDDEEGDEEVKDQSIKNDDDSEDDEDEDEDEDEEEDEEDKK
ncbi:hypothetical protein M0813_22686 [Anaeramoeba flamelloides]|uniref:Uncharacterized protein n=1 Tax=Anaeramoeba flamelloides TaxID=1746091 RepID=A0ABQ8YDA0_9EUKA|nr:hypothetical protein M0813_22686 [Anaeramoeba flamelloides]